MKIFNDPNVLTLIDKDGDKYVLSAVNGALTVRRFTASTGAEQTLAIFRDDAEAFAEHLVAFAKRVRG